MRLSSESQPITKKVFNQFFLIREVTKRGLSVRGRRKEMKKEIELQIIAKEVVDLLAKKDLTVAESFVVADLIKSIVNVETKLKDTK